MTILKATILLSLFACVEMWPRGAPNTTCVSMMPGHGRPRQAGPSPYTLTLSKKTYTPNENVQRTYMPGYIVKLQILIIIYSIQFSSLSIVLFLFIINEYFSV